MSSEPQQNRLLGACVFGCLIIGLGSLGVRDFLHAAEQAAIANNLKAALRDLDELEKTMQRPSPKDWAKAVGERLDRAYIRVDPRVRCVANSGNFWLCDDNAERLECPLFITLQSHSATNSSVVHVDPDGIAWIDDNQGMRSRVSLAGAYLCSTWGTLIQLEDDADKMSWDFRTKEARDLDEPGKVQRAR